MTRNQRRLENLSKKKDTVKTKVAISKTEKLFEIKKLAIAIEKEEQSKSFNSWKDQLPERLAKQQALKEQKESNYLHILSTRVDRKAKRAAKHAELLAKRIAKKIQKAA